MISGALGPFYCLVRFGFLVINILGTLRYLSRGHLSKGAMSKETVVQGTVVQRGLLSKEAFTKKTLSQIHFHCFLLEILIDYRMEK